MIVSSEPAEVFIVGGAICSVGVCEKVDRRNVREHWQKKVERAQVGVQWPRAQYCAEIGALLTKSFTLSHYLPVQSPNRMTEKCSI